MDDRFRLLTVGRIAERTGHPVQRVARMLRAHPVFHPVAWAGNARLFNHADLPDMQRELDAIAARQARKEWPHD
jgi:hypothetical protein